MFSDFKLGRFAGGGIRRAVATFPRLCKPCLGITAGERTGRRYPVTEAEAGYPAALQTQEAVHRHAQRASLLTKLAP